ncbi:hypothetical protein L0F63_005513, partial [Massospora cicadina]
NGWMAMSKTLIVAVSMIFSFGVAKPLAPTASVDPQGSSLARRYYGLPVIFHDKAVNETSSSQLSDETNSSQLSGTVPSSNLAYKGTSPEKENYLPPNQLPAYEPHSTSKPSNIKDPLSYKGLHDKGTNDPSAKAPSSNSHDSGYDSISNTQSSKPKAPQASYKTTSPFSLLKSNFMPF